MYFRSEFGVNKHCLITILINFSTTFPLTLLLRIKKELPIAQYNILFNLCRAEKFLHIGTFLASQTVLLYIYLI